MVTAHLYKLWSLPKLELSILFQTMSVILFNTKLSAAAAKHYRLATEILKTGDFEKELNSNIQRLLSVPLQVIVLIIEE